MKIWVNAQLPPAIANWIVENFDVEAVAVREINLRDATDPEIFAAAKNESAIVMTKIATLLSWSMHGERRHR